MFDQGKKETKRNYGAGNLPMPPPKTPRNVARNNPVQHQMPMAPPTHKAPMVKPETAGESDEYYDSNSDYDYYDESDVSTKHVNKTPPKVSPKPTARELKEMKHVPLLPKTTRRSRDITLNTDGPPPIPPTKEVKKYVPPFGQKMLVPNFDKKPVDLPIVPQKIPIGAIGKNIASDMSILGMRAKTSLLEENSKMGRKKPPAFGVNVMTPVLGFPKTQPKPPIAPPKILTKISGEVSPYETTEETSVTGRKKPPKFGVNVMSPMVGLPKNQEKPPVAPPKISFDKTASISPEEAAQMEINRNNVESFVPIRGPPPVAPPSKLVRNKKPKGKALDRDTSPPVPEKTLRTVEETSGDNSSPFLKGRPKQRQKYDSSIPRDVQSHSRLARGIPPSPFPVRKLSGGKIKKRQQTKTGNLKKTNIFIPMPEEENKESETGRLRSKTDVSLQSFYKEPKAKSMKYEPKRKSRKKKKNKINLLGNKKRRKKKSSKQNFASEPEPTTFVAPTALAPLPPAAKPLFRKANDVELWSKDF